MNGKLVALVLVAALNPLVLRSPEPHGNVPAGCEFGVGQPASLPPAQVAEARQIPVEEDHAAPLPPVVPAAKPRGAYDFGPLQRALSANNRAAFDAELATAREAGAQTRVYEDVARLWDAQFESPFFAEGSDAHRVASQYPGYEAAVREQVFTDASGRKFYPAAESRAFIARHTGAKIPSTSRTPSTSTRTPSTSTRKPSTQTRETSTRATPTRPSSSRPSSLKSKPPAATRTTVPPSSSPDPSAAARPAAVPAPVASSYDHTSSDEAPPAAGSLPTGTAVTTTSPDTALVTDTAAPTTTTASPTAPATDTTATTTASSEEATKPEGRSIVLPAILILIGLGVLILLLKTRA